MNDVLQIIFHNAATLCRYPSEKVDLQKSIIFVNKQFCLAILDKPIVSLSDALEVRDPLAANIAVRCISRKSESTAKAQLMDCPHVVAVALRLRGKRPIALKSAFDAYVNKLARVIVHDIRTAFIYNNIDHYSGNFLKVIVDRLNEDDWRLVASVIVRRRTKSIDALVSAAQAAYNKGHTQCLVFLSEYCPEFVCTRSLLTRARLMKRGCEYLLIKASRDSTSYLR